MTNKPKKELSNIALISTPWPLFNRPSIQLGSLKAYLEARMSDLQIDTFYLYLQLAEAIGYHTYHDISERTWLAESMYAALLYPGNRQQAQRLFRKESTGKARLQKMDFRTLTRKIKKATDSFIHSHNWQTYGLVGFSISLCQLTSALYVIKRLKKKCPKVTIVVGGALTSAKAAPALLKNFADIDMVVNGEGELPLYHIIKNLRRSSSESARSTIKGVFTRQTDALQPAAATFTQLKRLDDLPAPDYDAYFSLLKTFKPHKRFFPTQRGYLQQPTVVNNVETFCAGARIMELGADYYLQTGTPTSPGTKLLSVSGDCRLPGIHEVEWGTTVREILEKCEADRPHFIQVSGPSGECISMEEADRAIAFDDLPCGGSFMVFSRSRDILDILRNYNRFFKSESCGLCTPCRAGNFIVEKKLALFAAKLAHESDVEAVRSWGEIMRLTCRCGLGKTAPNALLGAMDKFPDYFDTIVDRNPERLSKGFDLNEAVRDYERFSS